MNVISSFAYKNATNEQDDDSALNKHDRIRFALLEKKKKTHGQMIRKSLFALRTISEVDAAFGAVYDDDDDEDDGILSPSTTVNLLQNKYPSHNLKKISSFNEM